MIEIITITLVVLAWMYAELKRRQDVSSLAACTPVDLAFATGLR